ncbi:hypothetical protein KKE06_05790, partial [Candidatus Micrarchaeota archaeon]|nr:hypothetical protein [Candidatus Micrarchaeota archaeon]MBU1930512.1 hypothetical protein [Candidatus Micrarchaeota archaeon]
MNPELKKVLEQKWYTQGFAGRPFFLVTVASIDLMHRGLGFSYNAIPFLYKKDYCEANYAKKDLKEHAEIILQKLEKNPEYLKEKRNQYNQEVAVFEEEYKTAETRTKKSDEKELFELSYRFGNSIESMAGIAHFHESISLRLEHEIRHLLMEKVKGKQLNEAFSTLTTPTAQSFLGKKEEALWIIKNAPQEKKEALAQEFIKNFFWVKSGYTGSHALTIIEVLDEADRLERFLKPDFEKIKKQKEQLFQQYDFTEKGIQWIQWSEFLTDWQDERKKNIFRAIFYADQALHEISKRYTIEVKYLHYLLPHEITLSSIQDPQTKKTAEKRIQGVVFVKKRGKTLVFD